MTGDSSSQSLQSEYRLLKTCVLGLFKVLGADLWEMGDES